MKESCFIGIDLGGTRIKIGLVACGKVISKLIVPAVSELGLQTRLPVIKEKIDELLNTGRDAGYALGGVAMAFPGIVNPLTQKVLSTNAKYDDAPALNLGAWVRENWQVPFFIDNDARMAAVGEWKYGAATDTDNFVAMTIGTGIGTAAVMEGIVLRGKHFQAGCLGGHLTIQYAGKPCTCGNIGCVEAYGSSWSLPERVKSHKGFMNSLLSEKPVIDFAALFEAYEQNDLLARELVPAYIETWSAGIVNLVHAYDPEIVVLGGGAMNSGQLILPAIEQRVKELAWCPWGEVQLRPTTLLSNAGLLGAVHCLQYKT